MTPKEKAEELFTKYLPIVNGGEQYQYVKTKAKLATLVAVNEILNQDVFNYTSDWSNTIEYWQEVKQEIEKL